MPEESVFTTAQTLAHIFPLINCINYVNDVGWQKVMDVIRLFGETIDYSGKEHLSSPRGNFSDASLGTTPGNGG